MTYLNVISSDPLTEVFLQSNQISCILQRFAVSPLEVPGGEYLASERTHTTT